jgi:methylmalonyl-CoA mutase C-terminal domain/subunit
MGMKKMDRIPRVLVAKIGLDGHTRGAQVVAYGLRDAGMEVIYTGIRQTPAGVARTAVEEDVDVIGISSMVGAHQAITKKLRKELEALKAADIPVVLGGIIPEEDYDQLRALGVSAIFPPGSEVKEMVQYINEIVNPSTSRPVRVDPQQQSLTPALETGTGAAEGVKTSEWVPEVPGTLAGKNLEDLHLLGSRCEGCGQIYFPSRRNCPHCLDDRLIKQIPLSDQGVLQTFVVASMAPPGYSVPHAQGYIDLSGDGPRIFSLLTDYGDGANLTIGCKMALKIVRLGRDEKNRVIVGYRFRPLKGDLT